MTKVLHITASAHIETSASRAASLSLIAGLNATQVTLRDLAADPLPQITGAWADARLTDPTDRSTEDAALLALSDTLIAEALAADTIVIAAPLYNFGAPAALKAWIDLLARPRVTFRYTDTGPVGLIEGKKALIVASSGGVPIGSGMDMMTPHLRLFLGFIGITDVTIFSDKDIAAQAA